MTAPQGRPSERVPASGRLAQFPFEARSIDLDGLRLAYLDEGRGDPVVLVHGNPSWSYLWRHLVLRLRSTHRAIAPDHVGCGRSDRPDDARYPYRLARRIDDLERLLAGIGADRAVTLVVHDWGGPIGLGWAVRHPERVRRIVLMNTAAFHPPAGRRLPWTLRLFRSGTLGELLVLRLNLFLLGWAFTGCRRGLLPAAVRRAYLEPYPDAASRLAVLRFVQDIPLAPGDPSYPALDAIDQGLARLAGVPMLILWGERDFVFDVGLLAEWERRFPGAEVHRFPKAGHLVMEDERDEVVERVARFVGGS